MRNVRSNDSAGKLAYITGGSEGIGFAIAEAWVQSRGGVVISSRSEVKLAAALKRLEKGRRSRNQTIASLSLDVTDPSAVEKQGSAVCERYGVPYYLINSAGFARPGYLQDLSIAQIREMMEVNYFGTVNTIKAFLPSLLRARRGHIVNVSSLGGLFGLFGYTGYCASKYAVIGFSEALRHELKPFGIRVSVLCPSNTRTPGLERENRIKPAEILALEEKVKTLPPSEVARALLKALPKNKFLIIPTWDGRVGHALNRWWPGFMARFILKR